MNSFITPDKSPAGYSDRAWTLQLDLIQSELYTLLPADEGWEFVELRADHDRIELGVHVYDFFSGEEIEELFAGLETRLKGALPAPTFTCVQDMPWALDPGLGSAMTSNTGASKLPYTEMLKGGVFAKLLALAGSPAEELDYPARGSLFASLGFGVIEPVAMPTKPALLHGPARGRWGQKN